jgi:hypothetical protein
MAFNDFRQTDKSFKVDESDSEHSNASDTQLPTATTTPTTTMATTTPTTATGTRPTTSQAGFSGQSFHRGQYQDGVYRPNASYGGHTGQQQQHPRSPPPTTTAASGGHRQQPPPQQSTGPNGPRVPQPGPPPQANPDLQVLYTDPGFLAAMRDLIQGIIPPQQQRPQSRSSDHSIHRSSTPINDHDESRGSRHSRRRVESPTNLTQDMRNLRTVETPSTPSAVLPSPERLSVVPTYIPAAEQALQIHKNAAASAKANADMFSGLAEFMNAMSADQPNQGIQRLVHTFTQKAILAQRDAKAKDEGLQQAQRVTRYYETPIARPAFPAPDHRRTIRVNHKELLMLTGYFDPNDKTHDFKHTWQKLLDYGTMNEFQEEHYMQALGSILKGEAYETFTEFKTMNKSLEDILDYFAGVYTKKRCLATDRKAVDEFTRRKGESIIVCMERAILAIDKLRYVYPPNGWAVLRQQMRQNILMQVVKEETKRAIQMEVDNVHEDTGMPYDFEKLIRFADRYERNHNTTPKDDLTTLFKVASGGLQKQYKRSSSQDQLSHLKKDNMLQKQIATLQAELKELKTNEARMYKNEGRRGSASRESRRTERDSSRRTDRSKSYDRNRNMDTTSSPPTSSASKPTASRPTSASSSQPRPAYSPPDPYAKRQQSTSPTRRGQTPGTSSSSNYRNRSSSYSRNASRSRDRDRERSKSRGRYDRTTSSASRTQSRSNSTGGTDHITSTGSKTVIITINGQEYVPRNKEN